MPGHDPGRAVVTPGVNPWVLGNLVIGGVVGLAVDGVTQSWYRLYPGEVEVRLRRLGEGPPEAPAEPPPRPGR
jgi:hypothetical protein